MTNQLEIKLLSDNATMPTRDRLDAGYQGNLGINIKNDKQNSPVDTNVYITINGDYKYASQTQESGTYKINKGDKLAQLVIVPIWTPELKEVDAFHAESDRGTDGFGSTGY